MEFVIKFAGEANCWEQPELVEQEAEKDDGKDVLVRIAHVVPCQLTEEPEET